MDSGGFSELHLNGGWGGYSPAEYIDFVDRAQSEIGRLQFAAPQDWMCENSALQATGLSVAQHQRRTVDNFLELRASRIGPIFIPVLQGAKAWDYLDHIEMYWKSGVDLRLETTVGLGSVCRRRTEHEFYELNTVLEPTRLRYHGFGVKRSGLRYCAALFTSTDSLAWSYDARHAEPLAGHRHKSCNNCIDYALKWRKELIGHLRA